MREVYDFLRKAGVWFLATAKGGQPRLRPFGSVCLYRERLYFLTGRTKAVSRELHANPRLELCALCGEAWLRVEGSAVLDDEPDTRGNLPLLDARYNPGEGETERWYLRNCAAALFSGAEMVKSWRF